MTGKLFMLDRALEPSLPAFLSLLDVLPPDADWHALVPSQRRLRTRDAVKRLLLRESQVQPLVLVFEDLHWIDSETQALLDGLVESLPTARLLLLVNYRPEYQHAWGGKTYYTQLRIDPLPAESAGELLDGLLGRGPDFEPLERLLIERTEGNPFFLEESVQALVETGVLAGERGVYRLARPLGTLQVPATVQAVLAARIDRLLPEDKHLLQAAAVIGKDVPFTLLQEIAEAPEGVVQQGLVRLQQGEFLYEASLFPELSYTFKHALTHEVTYGSLLQQRRRELHARIVGAIERLHAGRLAEHVDRLAHHAVRGELWEKVLDYARQAGLKAATQLVLREAAAYFEQAVAAADRLPRRREVTEQFIDLRGDLRTVLFPLAEYGRLRENLDQAVALSREIGDDRRLARTMASLAHYHSVIMGQSLPALDCARRAVAIAERAGAPILLGAVRFVLAQAQHGHGDHDGAIQTLRATIEGLRGDLEGERGGHAVPISLLSRVWLAFALTEVGEFGEALAAGEAAVRQGETLSQPYSLYHAHWAVCAVHLGRGEHARAAEAGGRLLRIGSEAGVQPFVDNATALRGHAHVLAGRVGEGLPLLEGALTTPERRPAFTWHRDLFYLGDAYLHAGRLEEALRTGRRSLDLARASDQRGREAHARRLLGDVHTACGEEASAEPSYREALALGTELGMRPLVARCVAARVLVQCSA